MSYLYLIRHTKSEWNEKGLWTGWADPHLSKEGFEEAKKAGEALRGEKIDMAFVASLIRVKETLDGIKESLGQASFPTIETKALNERNYGIFTGKNKWEIKKEVGDEEFQKIRRGWDHKIDGGETLKDVYNRVIPYYEMKIAPLVKTGRNIIIASSGNALRSLVKYLENIPDEKISEVEIGMGAVYRYKLDEHGKYLSKGLVYSGATDNPIKS